MKVVFLAPAQNELDEAVDWYNRQAAGLGRELLDELDRAVRRALAFPLSYPEEDKILPLIASSRGRLVVDLSQLDYVSSAGLRVFLLAAKRMGEAKGKMILCSLQEAVKQVFDIVGFTSFLTVVGSTEEAIKNV